MVTLVIRYYILYLCYQNTNIGTEYLGADTLTYTTANPLTRRFELKPGGKYHIISTKYEGGETGSFLLRIFSKQELKIR